MNYPSCDFQGNNRFTIRRRLGAGGMGIVYEVWDQEGKETVALKTLLRTDAADIYRFKKEFRALADVSHPNLVSLYELISEGDQLFFTMELLEGEDFITYVRKESNLLSPALRRNSSPEASTLEIPLLEKTAEVQLSAPDEIVSAQAALSPINSLPLVEVDIERLRAVLLQLAEGVCALHEAGKLHRDLKPSNVMVTKNGRVVVLDFGLATEFNAQGMAASMTMAGTPTYMSPEQSAGDTITESSDWYCVGVMLYEALTGRLPFQGKFLDVIRDKQHFDPPPPSTLVTGIPTDLDQLCCELLRRHPQARPAGLEVLQRLRQFAPTQSSLPTRQSEGGLAHTVRFVGRKPHLESLTSAFNTVKQGRAVTVYVHGNSGMGKSSLVRHFLEKLECDEEVIILQGRCYEQESVPYKALDSLIDALSRYLKRLPSASAEALMPRDVLALARLFPVLRQVKVVAEAKRRVLEIPDSQELRRRAFTALRELLGRIADQVPLVLFLDDLQWGDVDSAALLSELLRPPDPPPLLLLASYRSEEASTSPLLRALLPLQAGDVRELKIGELELTEAHELVQICLGAQPSVLPQQIESIAVEAKGSPFFIDELVRYAQMNYAAESSTHSFLLPDSLQETTLDAVIQRRVAHLPEPARCLLEIVALAGQPIELEIAKRALAFPAEEHAALHTLRAARLTRTREVDAQQQIETYHDRIREAVVASLSSEKRIAHHRNLAVALESAGRADSEMLTRHFHQAGDTQRATGYATAAAAAAAEALAFDRAADLYQLALELQTPASADARQLLEQLGDALANAGRGAEAAQAYLQAAERSDAVQALELQRRAAEQFLISGRFDAGMTVMRSVLEAVGLQMAPTPRRALLSLLLRRAHLLLRGTRFVEHQEGEIPPKKLLKIDICWTVAAGLSLTDIIRAADFQTRNLLLALQAGEPYRVARALAVEAGFSSVTGKPGWKRAERFSRAAATLARQVNHPHAIGQAAMTAGIAAFCNGQWKRGTQLCGQAEEILRDQCTGVAWELTNAQNFLLSSLYYLGEMGEIIRRYPDLAAAALERGNLYADTEMCSRHSFYWLALDEPEAASQQVSKAIRQWSHKGFHRQHYNFLLAQTEGDLYTGNTDEAYQRVTENWSSLSRTLLLRIQVLRVEARYLHARTALAKAVRGQELTSMLAIAETLAQQIAREKMLWCDPLVPLIRAGVANLQGNQERAITLLQKAVEGFQQADMELYAAAAKLYQGGLIGGEQGHQLRNEAATWMHHQQIKNPARMAQMLAAGFKEA